MSDLSDLISLKFDGIITKVEKLANSNINLIEKNEKLQTIIDNLEKQNELLKKSNGFYGDQWNSWFGLSGELIAGTDCEITEENRPSGGRRARKTQRQLAPLEAELKELKDA